MIYVIVDSVISYYSFRLKLRFLIQLYENQSWYLDIYLIFVFLVLNLEWRELNLFILKIYQLDIDGYFKFEFNI